VQQVREDHQPVKRDPLVFVEWQDSIGDTGRWTDLDQLRKSPPPTVARSVGWMVSKDRSRVVIVPHLMICELSDKKVNDGCGEISIPIRSILRIVKLRDPTRKAK
jgi:hypothetical protein